VTDMTQRLAALPAQRRARFLTRLREHEEAVAGRGPTSRGDTGPTPLSHPQQTLRFLGHPASGTPLCLRLRGTLDADALRSALAAVVARHEALRTAIVTREGAEMQVVATEVPVELPVLEAEGDRRPPDPVEVAAEFHGRRRGAVPRDAAGEVLVVWVDKDSVGVHLGEVAPNTVKDSGLGHWSAPR